MMNLLISTDPYPSWIHKLELEVFGSPWGPLAPHEIVFIETPWAYARWSINLVAKEAELLRIVTHPSHLRKGKAKGLLLASDYYFKQQGVDHLLLEVRESNTAARELYQNLGWSFYRQRISYYSDGENAQLYEKRL
ncbi:MAG: GNAT family N-acetyltransferase [Holophagaceae bacterium]|jgi:ribosomal protein S18 acetylase RimI-like enzyme